MTGLQRAWWALSAVFGVAATLAFVAVRWLQDDRQLTYVAGVLAFWWLLPAVVLLLVAVLRRRWGVTATLAVPAVAWLWVFGPLFLPGAPAALATEAAVELRVATFNVSPKEESGHVVELARRAEADVLLLQEVLPEARRSLERDLDEYPYRWFSDITHRAPGGGGVAVVSRYPIIDVDPVEELPEGARPTAVVSLDADGHELAVVPVHLASPCAECLREHVSKLGNTGEATRIRRAETPRLVAALPDVPVIVGGDLNSSVLNEPLSAFTRAGLTDVHRAVGWGPGFTRGSKRNVARIDFLLAGNGVTPLRSHVERARGSDHRPVIADVRLPG